MCSVPIWSNNRIPSRSVLKPVCDELLADVDVNLPQLSITRIHELVGNIRGDNDDLSCVRFKRGGADCEGRHAFLDDENLLVGMLMQPYGTPGGMSTQINETSVS